MAQSRRTEEVRLVRMSGRGDEDSELLLRLSEGEQVLTAATKKIQQSFIFSFSLHGLLARVLLTAGPKGTLTV